MGAEEPGQAGLTSVPPAQAQYPDGPTLGLSAGRVLDGHQASSFTWEPSHQPRPFSAYTYPRLDTDHILVIFGNYMRFHHIRIGVGPS